MAQFDKIHDLALLADLAELTIATTLTSVTSEAVDTLGCYAVGFGVVTDRALVAEDVAAYSFLESDDNVTYTAVPVAGSLPSRKQPANTLVIAESGQIQKIGVFSSKRYVKVQLDGTADTTEINVVLRPMLWSDVGENTAFDPSDVPSDLLP